MGIPLLDEHGLPPTGARVYVKSKHGIGTVAEHENGKVWVNMDRGMGMGKEGNIVKCKGGDDLIVIGPPELLGHCAVDTCPICEEPIRIRKHER